VGECGDVWGNGGGKSSSTRCILVIDYATGREKKKTHLMFVDKYLIFSQWRWRFGCNLFLHF
jgi:hypothetical protein